MRFQTHILLASAFAVMGLAGCAVTGKAKRAATEGARELPAEPVIIRFGGKAGETTQTHYFSNSRTRKYEEGQITNDRTEIVEFTIASKVVAATENLISTLVKTVHKDGASDLHDLAFPELHEEIEMETRPSGEVMRAGRYPPQSVFYVPSLPLPPRSVSIGDTWPMEYTWYSGRENIPLNLAVVGILKNIVSCERNKACVDMEVSGNVKLAAAGVVAGPGFESRVWGRVLFSLSRGDVIWSEMRSREEMRHRSERTLVDSCMISQMEGAGAPLDLSCDPKEQPVTRIPASL